MGAKKNTSRHAHAGVTADAQTKGLPVVGVVVFEPVGLLVGLVAAPRTVVAPAAALIGGRTEAGPEATTATTTAGRVATTAATAKVVPTAGRTPAVAHFDLLLVGAARRTVIARRTVAEAAAGTTGAARRTITETTARTAWTA